MSELHEDELLTIMALIFDQEEEINSKKGKQNVVFRYMIYEKKSTMGI